MKHTKLFLSTSIGLALLTGSANAALVAYSSDANTLNLWNFNETIGSTVNDTENTHDLTSIGGATLGSSGFSGFGNAGNTNFGTDAGFRKTGVLATSLTGNDGAFTFEAMVTLQNLGGGQQFIAHEGDGILGGRGFHFKTTGAGSLTLTNIAGGSSPTSMAIPTAGAHAFVANEWFHIAVTYTGDEGAINNFKYYWTRVDSGATEANLLGTTTMGADVTGTSNVLGVGNEFRGTATGSTEGLIDEVRISDIARGADDFIFTVPEPSSAALFGLGGLMLLLSRRRT